MKNSIKYILSLILLLITLNAKSQDRPLLEVTYLTSEYNKLMSLRSIPQTRIASIYLSSGINNTMRIGTSENIHYPTSFQDQLSSQVEKGFHINLGYLKPITKNIDINVGIKYSTNTHSISNIPFNGYSTFIHEKQTNLSIPVKGKYSFFKSSFRPFVELGVKYSRLMSAKIDAKRTGGQSLNIDNISVLGERERNLFSMNVGLGLEYSFYKGSLFVLGTYSRGLSQLVISDKRFDNTILRNEVRYASPDFTLNSVEISIGYSFFLFEKE